MPEKKLKILVTGASKGIGFEIAKEFAINHDVYVIARNKETLEKISKKYNFKGFYAIDLTVENAVENLFSEIKENFDVLINNAGVYLYNPVEKLNNNEILYSIKLNTIAPLKLIRQVIPYMKNQKWGRIINIGSISGVVGEANASVYSMTKSALIGMTKSLALELAQDGITVNTINPGWVDTELINNENLEEDFSKEEILETIPQRRFVMPSEIANLCKYLISQEAKTLTGQSINICAGLSVGC